MSIVEKIKRQNEINAKKNLERIALNLKKNEEKFKGLSTRQKLNLLGGEKVPLKKDGSLYSKDNLKAKKAFFKKHPPSLLVDNKPTTFRVSFEKIKDIGHNSETIPFDIVRIHYNSSHKWSKITHIELSLDDEKAFNKWYLDCKNIQQEKEEKKKEKLYRKRSKVKSLIDSFIDFLKDNSIPYQIHTARTGTVYVYVGEDKYRFADHPQGTNHWKYDLYLGERVYIEYDAIDIKFNTDLEKVIAGLKKSFCLMES